MKKILLLFFGFLCIFAANAAQVANVEYVHTLIEQEWDISIPYNSALSDVHTVANMKYLLTAIDVANEILNGEKTTDYGNGEFATLQAADTIATNQAVETLIQKPIEYKFFLTTTSTNSFSFSISAAGKFYVDWGDGKTETITKPDTTDTTYTHNYDTSNTYTIGIGGQAIKYDTDEYAPAISFYSSASKIVSIDGSLGAIFGTLADGSQPRFMQSFGGAKNIENIPENLFAGIYGNPATNIFFATFSECTGLTSIPDGLFSGISGAPAERMFYQTFHRCSGLISIPENLFGNISGAAQKLMFFQTFLGCTSLTGSSARINGQYLYEIWPDATSSQVGDMYGGATGLSDYSSIPDVWK